MYFRTAFDEIISRRNIEKIKTIGDAYMAAGGLPEANLTNPVDTVLAGLEMLSQVEKMNEPAFRGTHRNPYGPLGGWHCRCQAGISPTTYGVIR